MFKFGFGDATNPKTNETKYIMLDYKDSFKSILIGLGIAAAGAIIGTITTGLMGFKSGAAAFSDAEYRTLDDLGLIGPIVDPEKGPEINEFKKREPK